LSTEAVAKTLVSFNADFSGQKRHVLYCTWAIAEEVLEKKGIYRLAKGKGQIM
jgi:hypothetical protein